jgi:CRISPR-associated protein Cas5t
MAPTLESRIVKAVKTPGEVNRTGVLCLGLSDDAVDDISLLDSCEGMWHWLTPKDDGDIELPVWVDHVGSFYTRWQRYCFGTEASVVTDKPSDNNFTKISDPRS